jgi:hypothetical protein
MPVHALSAGMLNFRELGMYLNPRFLYIQEHNNFEGGSWCVSYFLVIHTAVARYWDVICYVIIVRHPS